MAAELPGDQVVNAPREIGLITSVTDFTALLLPCMYEKRRRVDSGPTSACTLLPTSLPFERVV